MADDWAAPRDEAWFVLTGAGAAALADKEPGLTLLLLSFRWLSRSLFDWYSLTVANEAGVGVVAVAWVL